MSSSPFHTLENSTSSMSSDYTGDYESFYPVDSGHGVPGKMIPTLVDCQVPDDNVFKTYTNLDGSQQGITAMDKPHHLLKQNLKTEDVMFSGAAKYIKSEDSEMRSWEDKHPHNWTVKEVLDWVYTIAQVQDFTSDPGDKFNDVSGEELCTMSKEQFIKRDSEHGEMLYDYIRRHCTDSNFTDPNSMNYDISSNGMDYEECLTLDITEMLVSHRTVNMHGHKYDVDISDNFQDLPAPTDDGYCSGGYDRDRTSSVSSDDSADGYQPQGFTGPPQARQPLMPPQKTHIPKETPVPQMPSGSSDKPIKIKRPPGRPRKNPDGTPKPPSQRGRKPGQTAKGNHLWEFVRELLQSPQYNPRLLKWEDKSEGVFRFVQSEQVAALWGKKKNNPNMTYEKLSRAMRFCRSAEYFQSVPKDGRYPKKLCFKFGTKAKGWYENC
jgi:hypothetical protein